MTIRMRSILAALLVAAVATLAGCALAPPPRADEVRAQALPNVAVPAAWTAPGGAQGEVRASWLATFHEPRLDALVREALAYNGDLRVAAARVEQAAAYAKLANSTIYPVVNLLAHGGLSFRECRRTLDCIQLSKPCCGIEQGVARGRAAEPQR